MNIANEHKKTAAIILKGLDITYDKLTAKTWDFTDLGRDSRVFVTVHGIRFNSVNTWELAKATAREHGFRLSIKGDLLS